MSRKKKHGNHRRRRRADAQAKFAEKLANSPQAPARLLFFGKGRRGEAAEVKFDFRNSPVVPVNLGVEDPGEELREGVLKAQWASAGHPTQGSWS